MHPNPLFRNDDRDALEALIAQVGFGIVFLTTPDGPRVAHVPLLSDGAGAIRFHLASTNALTPHLDNARALVVVNGPDGYVSPRWYENRDTVPTWDYVALEMEGTISRLDDVGLEELLQDVIDTFENRIEGERWLANEASESTWSALFGGIVGFSMQVDQWRPTFKLSQKRSAPEIERIAAGHRAAGNNALADAMQDMTA